jgi:hypothetical protein
LIGKGTSDGLKNKRLSFKIGLFVVLLSGLVIFTHYRAAMNAFLVARITHLPVNNLLDIYEKEYTPIMYENAIVESFLNSSAHHSIFYR